MVLLWARAVISTYNRVAFSGVHIENEDQTAVEFCTDLKLRLKHFSKPDPHQRLRQDPMGSGSGMGLFVQHLHCVVKSLCTQLRD